MLINTDFIPSHFLIGTRNWEYTEIKRGKIANVKAFKKLATIKVYGAFVS